MNLVSDVYIGGQKMTISNLALQAMFTELDVEVLNIEEPQIAGVTDTDIVDESQPVAFEDVVDENIVDRSVDLPVTDATELTA